METPPGQELICVEQILPDEQNKMQNIVSNSAGGGNLKAAFYSSKLWAPGNTITIGFLGNGNNVPRHSVDSIKGRMGSDIKLDPLQTTVESLSVPQAVKKIVEERIQPIVGLKLEFISNPNNANIRISFDPSSGAWSLLGTDCLRQVPGEATMNLGWFDVATTIHEFCHALGMIHEHQNPRSNMIDWDPEAVYNWASTTQGWSRETTKTNILQKYDTQQINGSEYDGDSIMLYFFPGSLTKNNKGTEENPRMSMKDVIWLNKMYPNSPESPEEFYNRVYNVNLERGSDEVQTVVDTNGGDQSTDEGEPITCNSGDCEGGEGGEGGGSEDKGKGVSIWLPTLVTILVILSVLLVGYAIYYYTNLR